MKRITFLLICFIFLSFYGTAEARRDISVRGYYRSNGTYVRPHKRTYPDRTYNNNYTTRGNRNPYTGKKGYRPRDEDYKKLYRYK